MAKTKARMVRDRTEIMMKNLNGLGLTAVQQDKIRQELLTCAGDTFGMGTRKSNDDFSNTWKRVTKKGKEMFRFVRKLSDAVDAADEGEINKHLTIIIDRFKKLEKSKLMDLIER